MSEPYSDETHQIAPVDKQKWVPRELHGGLKVRARRSGREQMLHEKALIRGVEERDLEIQRQKLEVARHQAEAGEDYLTNIYNKRGVIREFERIRGVLNREIGIYRGYTVVILDMIGLKAMNENPAIGPSGADKVLKSVATSLSQNKRDTDIAGRIGGDEYIFLVINPEPVKTPELVGRLLENMPEGVRFNVGYRNIGPEYPGGVEQTIDETLETVDLEVKKMGPVDANGRSLGRGVVVDIDTMQRVNV